jgi:hypothetical protein
MEFSAVATQFESGRSAELAAPLSSGAVTFLDGLPAIIRENRIADEESTK